MVHFCMKSERRLGVNMATVPKHHGPHSTNGYYEYFDPHRTSGYSDTFGGTHTCGGFCRAGCSYL